jgi:hypothetical protein
VRVSGYWFGSGDGPVVSGWLPVGDLSVVMGANDSGKSRLLRRLEGDLNALEALHSGAPEPDSLVFLELDPDDLWAILDETYRTDLAGAADRTVTAPQASMPWADAPDSKAAWIAYVRWTSASLPGALRAIALMEESRTIALRPLWDLEDFQNRPLFRIYWCAPPLVDLTGEDRRAVEAFREGVHLQLDPGAPTPVGRLGTTGGPLLPSPVRLPVPDEVLLTEASEAVSQWLAARSLLHEVVGGNTQAARVTEERGALAQMETLPEPADAWLVQPAPHSLRLAEEVLAAFEVMNRAGAEARVPFLSAGYDLRIEPAPLTELAQVPATRVRLIPHPGDGAPRRASEEAADGLAVGTTRGRRGHRRPPNRDLAPCRSALPRPRRGPRGGARGGIQGVARAVPAAGGAAARARGRSAVLRGARVLVGVRVGPSRMAGQPPHAPGAAALALPHR